MAKINYGFQKRQKEMARKSKKEEKLKKKQERGEGAAHEEHDAVEEVRAALAGLDPDTSLHALGSHILATLESDPEAMPYELVESFLERVEEET